MDIVPKQGHSDSLRDQIVRAICPGHYVGGYPNIWIDRANAVLALMQPGDGVEAVKDVLDPTYQRGFVAGANAVLTDALVLLGQDAYETLTREARESGYIA